jgi:hypothetical protein
VAGYSKRSLVAKLGIKDGATIAILNAPRGYDRVLGKLPPQVRRRASATGPLGRRVVGLEVRAATEGPLS